MPLWHSRTHTSRSFRQIALNTDSSHLSRKLSGYQKPTLSRRMAPRSQGLPSAITRGTDISITLPFLKPCFSLASAPVSSQDRPCKSLFLLEMLGFSKEWNSSPCENWPLLPGSHLAYQTGSRFLFCCFWGSESLFLSHTWVVHLSIIPSAESSLSHSATKPSSGSIVFRLGELWTQFEIWMDSLGKLIGKPAQEGNSSLPNETTGGWFL